MIQEAGPIRLFLLVLQLRKNICSLFHILALFSLNTSERKLDHYHQKVNEGVAIRSAKIHQSYDLRKLVNFKNTPEMFGIDGKVLNRQPKRLQNCEKSAVKHFIEKPMLLSFVDLSTTSRPGLQYY